MKQKAAALLANKQKTLPILSFPAVQLLGIGVSELIGSAQMQCAGMEAIAARCAVGASLNMMDLSVEAECFGATIRFSSREVPTVTKGVIDDIEEARELAVPPVGSGRTAIYLDGVALAKQRMPEQMVFCGVIGPYSLACRLFDMSELMLACYDSEEDVHILLQNATDFLIAYVRAFQAVGADGVVIAEPAAGLLSPKLAAEFSMPYVRQILDAVNREDFLVCYHNCGNTVSDMEALLQQLDVDIFHFGNAVDIRKLAESLPKDKLVMGNVDPVLLRKGTPEQIRQDVRRVYDLCGHLENFMISTGCDVPADAKWENIDAYFDQVAALYPTANQDTFLEN